MAKKSEQEHSHEMQHGEHEEVHHEMQGMLPHFKQLHVVLHGMICVRLSNSTRTVQLHYPNVPMHEYHFGSFDNPKALPYGHDYQLGGVRVGDFEPQNTQMKVEHATICLSEHQTPGKSLTCVPRATHATVTLPWPQFVGGVRKILNPPPGVFLNTDVNPQSLYYITYLTYLVGAEDVPVLTKCCDDAVWISPNPTAANTRLHFYADPFTILDKGMVPRHLSDAFGRLNDQCFGGNFSLVPNVPPTVGFQFQPDLQAKIIPSDEAKDFGANLPENIEKAIKLGGTGGNCFQVVVLD